MGKYEPLQRYLSGKKAGEIRVSFRDVEQILGFSLPESAFRYPAWWSNDATSHSHSRAWIEAGWKTEQVDVEGRKLTFRKRQRNEPEGQPRPSIFGGLKGTVKVMPGVDLTEPTGVVWDAQEGHFDE